VSEPALKEASWPACSPDLSPIEPVWGCIKNKIDVTNVDSAEKLAEEVERISDCIPMPMINNNANSFKPRIWAFQYLRNVEKPLPGHQDMIQIY
jgi:hypothetical protein